MLRRLASLEPRRAALLARALLWIAAARALLAAPRASLAAWERGLAWLAAALPRAAPCSLDEATWAVTAAARRVPGTRCLAWSLAMRGFLAQAGLASELRIGAARDDVGGGLVAHAWIEHEGRSASWGPRDRYAVLRARATAS